MDSSDSACLVCHETVEIFAMGKCDHPICFKCSTRMRALCQQFYCPICRTDLPEVYFLSTREKFADMPVRKFIPNRKLKIFFENEHVQERVDQLLEHRCSKKGCEDRPPDKKFRDLRDHMRKVHHLFYCDLCLELKIFPSERKVYNRQDLAHHRRLGDKDDKSYKGHPLCKFCEERYLDRDELYKHLRKDHFFCHFCESLGSQDFYNDYDDLRDHFKADHFLCEEGDCASVQFTNAFRSDIDLQAHRSAHHSKAQSKSQARQERTLNIDINYGPRPNNRSNRGGRDEYEGRRGGGRPHSGHGGGGARYGPNSRERDDIERAIQASLSTMKEEDFKKEKPSKQPPPASPNTDFVQTEENFPSLTTTNSSVPVTSESKTQVSTDSSVKTTLANRCALGDNKSVQHGSLNDFPSLSETRPKPLVSTAGAPSSSKSQSFLAAFKPGKTEEDFPELPSSSNQSVKKTSTWIKPAQPVKPKVQAQRKAKVNSVTKVTYSDSDFPSLGAASNVSVSGTWVNSKNNKIDKKVNGYKNAEAEDPCVDIRDRFSPVTVPDSDKNDKTKTKKKKKKDKVSEIKEEKSSQLKGNSSLDDIASLLMSSFVNTEEKVEEAKVVNSVSEEKKAKKKEDKVEKRLESSKIEQRQEEKKTDVSPVQEVPETPVSISKEEDFPVLQPTSQPKKPPPGFMGGSSTRNPPPGLSKALNCAHPPPGFMAPSSNVDRLDRVEKISMPMSSDLTNFQYTQPEEFQSRNQELIKMIQSLCADDPKKFADFKTLSGEFRRSEIDASTYYIQCEKTLGKKIFHEIFQELVALLPDINKQQELLSMYLSAIKKQENVKSASKFKDSKGAWAPSSSGFLTCQVCRQVLLRKDYNCHVSSHSLDNDFPALFNATATESHNSSGAWVRAK